MSGVICQVSGVTCHVSCVRCQVSLIFIYLFFCLVIYLYFFYKVVWLVGGGSVINAMGPTPSSLYCFS